MAISGLGAAVLGVMVLGCAPSSRPRTDASPLERAPVDSARVSSAEEAAGWGYRREGTADLDGDGAAERVVIASDVSVVASGDPIWEDGHRWAVLVQPSSGTPTLLYAAFVPRGFAEAAITRADDQGRRRVMVQERTPEQVRALEVAYEGPGRARLVSDAYTQVEQWLPGAAVMP